MKTLTKTLWGMVYTLPAVLFFSYYPIISLGSNSSMNFELSLSLIWLVIFDVLAFAELILLARVTRQDAPTSRSGFTINLPGLSDRRFFLLALFPLYLTLSVLWSANPLRGLLTAGVMWLVFCAVFAILYVLPLASPPGHLRRDVLYSLLISGVLVSIFCFIQSVLDMSGLSREVTLMCAGCTYRSFGFPHPSGFAIEPQFMGNLLLAPTLTALYLTAFRRPNSISLPKLTSSHSTSNSKKTSHISSKTDQQSFSIQNQPKITRILLFITAFFLSTTLFFTFSRGAIYAYAIALLALFIFALRRRVFRWSLIAIPVGSFLISLILQGAFAAVGPTSETFTSAIAKSIHQLSLGIIDLRGNQAEVSATIPSALLSQEDTPINQNPSLPNPHPFTPVENSAQTVEKNQPNVEKLQKSVENNSIIVDNSAADCAKDVYNFNKTVDNAPKTVQNSHQNCAKPVQNLVYNPVQNQSPTFLLSSDSTADSSEETHFDGYVAESTNVRLSLNSTAIKTWLNAPYRHQVQIGADCSESLDHTCLSITPSSILFGVGLGGAGTAMHAEYPDEVTSPKEIVQHQGFSLLLETGLVGILLLIFELAICFFPNLFSHKFLDGHAIQAKESKNRESARPAQLTALRSASARAAQTTSSSHVLELPTFWHHPALPLLLALIVAYLVTLNFFAGLPNALQIYLMPPLLYLIFATSSIKKSSKNS